MSTICTACYESAVEFGVPPAVDELEGAYYTMTAPSCCMEDPDHPAYSMYEVYDLV